jgi:inorganic triphosphatase YgiF
MSKRQPREIEAALVIRSDAAEKIAKAIAALDAIGGYRLEPQETQKIRDLYFDTPDRALEKRRLGLRIRQVNGKTLITLKGPLRKNGASRARLEIEAAWSQKALARVRAELRDRKIELKKTRGVFNRADPLKTMTRLGLEIAQDRRTRRQVRKVLTKKARVPMAELAVDAVSYRFGKQAAHFREIEIEAKQSGARLADVIEPLQQMFKPTLRVWEGKYATGRVVEELLKKESPRKLLDDGNNLTIKTLDRIERKLIIERG